MHRILFAITLVGLLAQGFASHPPAAAAAVTIRGSMFDGTAQRITDIGTPVIAQGNARSDIVMTASAVVSPTPQIAPTPTVTPAPSAEGTGDGGGSPLGVFLLVVLLGAGGAAIAFAVRARRD